MKDKFRKALITLSTFIIVFILHIFYFKVTEGGCGSTPWLQKYIKEQDYFLGISYALSLAFMAFAFLKYKENRKSALKAGLGSGLLAALLWFSCFFFGCCGSPMIIVYLNLFGLSTLRIPKAALLLMTIIFIGIAYVLLIKNPGCYCDVKTHKNDEN
ncbi:MAG: hypothetical protein AABY43_01425 [Candidatus Omnitrophota bacterium]